MPEIPQRNFTGGELDPALHARADLQKYNNGLATLRNMKIHPQGGVSNREGLEFVKETRASFKGLGDVYDPRLIPFEFNKEQAYILEFGDEYLRVIKDGGVVLEAGLVITAITQASPAVVTITGHPFVEGDFVLLSGIVGMTELNGRTFMVVNETANTFELVKDVLNGETWVAEDSTGYSAYVSGGIAEREYHIVSPYDQADLPLLKFTQSADVMTITHPDYMIRYLSRLDHDDWTFSQPTYTAIPAEHAIASVVAGGTGAGANSKDYEYVITWTDDYLTPLLNPTYGMESLPSATPVGVTTGSLSETHYNDITWLVNFFTPEFYDIYKAESETSDLYGWIGRSKTLTFRDYNLAPDMTDQPPVQPVSPFTGAALTYPGCVEYYQQRQWFGRTNDGIQTIWATDAGDFSHFTQSSPIKASDSIEATIASRKVNEIRHFVELNSMLVLTSGGEWVVTEGQEGVVTPATIGFRRQTSYGSEHTRPVIVGDSALFVQIGGKTVRDLAYNLQSDGYTGNDTTLLAQHLFTDSTVREMAYALEPDGIVWVVMEDGSLRGLTYQKEHSVFGWHRHDTNGTFRSVASIPENNLDAVYFVVKRDIGGQEVSYIERMHYRDWTVAEDAFIVDSGLTYDGAPATVISGLDHLEGELVSVLADGNVVNGITVTSGAITLATAASKVHIGLQYVSDFETLDVDPMDAPVRGKPLNIGECVVKVLKSRGGQIGPDSSQLNDLPSRNVGDSYDPIALRTTEYRVSIEEDWSSNGRLFIRQSDPLPITILAVIPDTDVG